jgi:copper chaperone
MGTSQTISVTGMTCEHCVRAVGSELSKLPGVTSVEVDLASGRVAIESDAALSSEAIAAAIDEAGYEVSS